MQEILLLSKKRIQTRDKGILLHFDSLPFYEESGISVQNTLVNLVPGKFENAIRVSNNLDSKLALDITGVDLSGSFTVEFWARFNGQTATNIFLVEIVDYDLIPTGTLRHGFGLQQYVNNYYIYGTTGNYLWTGAPNKFYDNTDWKHHALSYQRTSSSYGVLRYFINGTLKAEVATNIGFKKDSKIDLFIGNHFYYQTPAFSADIDEFLINPGVAKYTANFTPPTAPFILE